MLGQRILCVLFPPHFPHPSGQLFGLGCFTHRQLCFRVLFSCERTLPLCQVWFKWFYLYLVRRSPVSPMFSWDADVVVHALMNLWGEFTSCLLFPSRQPLCCWCLFPKQGPTSQLPYTLSRLQIYVVNTSLCSSSQTVQADALHSRLSHPCSAKFTIMKVTVRIDGVPERSASQAGLPRHLNGVCQHMQALRLSKHCHSFPPVLGI